MRYAKLIIFLSLLLVAAWSRAQEASVNVHAAARHFDDRPFGKYLMGICTIFYDESTAAQDRPRPGTVKCDLTPLAGPRKGGNAPGAGRIVQTITLKLACAHDAADDCVPDYPLVPGKDFYVNATSDSGLPVVQTVLSGGGVNFSGQGTVSGQSTVHYHVLGDLLGAGSVVIRATARGNSQFAPAAPVDFILQVSASAKDTSAACPVLPPPLPAPSTLLDAPAIVSLMGNPTPFVLAAQGSNNIVVYSTRQSPNLDERNFLTHFEDSVALLVGRTASSLGVTPSSAKPFSVELTIPHAAALGDLATRIGGLNYSQLTVQDAGASKIRVTATTTPDCDTWQGFLKDVRSLTWRLVSSPMSKRLFYLSSSDVATAFSGLSSAPATATPAASPSSPAASSSSSTSSATAAGSGSTSASITVTQPPGSNLQINSDTTPCVVAGLAFGSTSACASATSPAPAAALSTAAPAAAAQPIGMASLPVTTVSVSSTVSSAPLAQTPADLLVFSDTNPGDDAQVMERNRVLAQLDLPRPEMIISAWVMQNSSSTPETMGAFTNMVKELVAEYNQKFESVVKLGWESVKEQSAKPNYFNEAFRSYIADRYVVDSNSESKPSPTVTDLAQAYLDGSQAKLVDPIAPRKRSDLEICERERYCLGYNDLFHPVKPALTDLVLTLIAAQRPEDRTNEAINYVEGHPGSMIVPLATGENDCEGLDREHRSRCQAIWRSLGLDFVPVSRKSASCATQDYLGTLYSLFLAGGGQKPRVYLRCFQEKLSQLFQSDDRSSAPPYGVGLLRGAIADFLYNYKISTQYPHDFTPYDLSRSADALNNALSPIIDAFNRDLTSFQLFLRADMQYQVERINKGTDNRCCAKRLFGLDKPSFFNDGLVTVRTVSGQETMVSTTSQSFLNASTAPELSALLNSLASPAGGSGGGSGSGPSSAVTGILSAGALARFQQLSTVLANYQSSFAQIGRSLSIDATPRSLATASSAEIAVTLKADETPTGPAYTGGGANDPALNTSRLATHDTTTRVRVDSVKLFEISSFSAILERSHTRIPLLPPLVEIPYIGTLAGIPISPAREYHVSSAVLSAYVVPTAADLAYGLRYVSDLVVDGLNPGPCSFYKGAAGPEVTNVCLFRKPVSTRDLDKKPLNDFNHRIVQCFEADTSSQGCLRVSFDTVPAMFIE
jgi:hypothetical protein